MQLRLHEVANWFAVSESTVYEWVRDASLPARWVNNSYRFNRGELIEWATLRHMPLPDKLLRLENGDTPPSLHQALAAGGIHYEVPGGDRSTALREAVARIPQLAGPDRQQLLELMQMREATGTTAIGKGIAVPHPSRPVVLPADQPLMTLCFLKEGADFRSEDGVPVQALFLLVTPSSRIHLQLLAQLASALRSDGFRTAIEKQKPAKEILAAAQVFMERTVAPVGRA